MAPNSRTNVQKNVKSTKTEKPVNAPKVAALPIERFRPSQTVSIIGAGRLGTALGLALSACGYSIQTVVSRHTSSARRTARLIGGNTLTLSIDQLPELPESQVIFITTSDDTIESVAGKLTTEINWSGRGHIALHASGALSSESLTSLRAVGFHTGSMHPLVSISDPKSGAENLKTAHFCIEGQAKAVRMARSMVRSLGGKSFSIQTREKALYHAAAVMSSGHMVALFDIATEMLTRCGLTRLEATGALLPLLKSTVENLTVHSPARALTGTFARGDAATVHKHLAALLASGDADAIAAYKLLGLRSLELARESGSDVNHLNRFNEILEVMKKCT